MQLECLLEWVCVFVCVCVCVCCHTQYWITLLPMARRTANSEEGQELFAAKSDVFLYIVFFFLCTARHFIPFWSFLLLPTQLVLSYTRAKSVACHVNLFAQSLSPPPVFGVQTASDVKVGDAIFVQNSTSGTNVLWLQSRNRQLVFSYSPRRQAFLLHFCTPVLLNSCLRLLLALFSLHACTACYQLVCSLDSST